MLPRVLAAAATAWSVVYLVAYLWLIDAQDGAIAWWYVVLMVLAALSFAAAALGFWARAALTVALVISALAMLVALLSLGVLLAPSVVAAAIALVVTRRRAHPHAGNGRTGTGARVNGASSEASHGAAEEVSSTFRLVSPSTMSQASGSDRASRSSLVTIKVSPAQQAASASRNPVRWRLVLVRPWSP